MARAGGGGWDGDLGGNVGAAGGGAAGLAVFVKVGKGTIGPRALKLLLAAALLAVFVALLHMEARVMAAAR